jgi:AAA ATPase domain
MATRVSSSRFVGRAPELAELSFALEAADAGTPSLVLVAGDSGVGKSRLVSEFAERARQAGARFLSGDCVELGEGELPNAPLISALRPLVRSEDPAFAALADDQRADLATIVPGLTPSAEHAPAQQVRVFEALLALLDVLGDRGPVVLAIEDLGRHLHTQLPELPVTHAVPRACARAGHVPIR